MNDTADQNTPYYRLDPDTVLQSVESTGLLTDGRLLALNSYENRVYQVGIEEEQPVVVKFYRPGRWSDEQIREEHSFSLELEQAEIPLVAPTVIDGETLFHHDGFRFTVFRRQGGHAPELEDQETRLWLGRFIGRIHAVGRSRAFDSRPAVTPEAYGDESIRTLIEDRWIPPHLENAFVRQQNEIYFPVPLSYLRADIQFRHISAQVWTEIGDLRVYDRIKTRVVGLQPA